MKTDESELEVEAMCADQAGGTDSVESLCGRLTPEELCKALLKVLRSDWGLENAEGEVALRLTIQRRTR